MNDVKEIFAIHNERLPIIGSVLFEKHDNKCTCSYCREPIYKSIGSNYHVFGLFGLCLPKNKSWNSWRVIFFKFFGSNYYLRWTKKHNLIRVHNNG
jgi:hypothetical protein